MVETSKFYGYRAFRAKISRKPMVPKKLTLDNYIVLISLVFLITYMFLVKQEVYLLRNLSLLLFEFSLPLFWLFSD